MARSPMEQLGQDIADLLNDEAYFADVPVFYYREGRIASEINKALAGLIAKANKVGVAVVVNMPEFDAEAEVPGPLLSASITIECVENPLLNFGDLGTQKTAEQIAEQVAAILQHHFAEYFHSALHPARGFITPSRAWEDRVAVNVRFNCRVPLAQKDRAEMPTMVFANIGGGNFTCTLVAEPGATIYYTEDESLPKQSSTGYTDPFVVPAGTIVRARAYIAGKVGSHVQGKVAA